MKHATTTTARSNDRLLQAGPGRLTAVVVWTALVAIGVAGRLWQPGWNVTPMAGVALAAGAVFPNSLVAASVPVVALAVGNLFLPGYGSFAMAAVIYAATAWPILLGRVVGDADGLRGSIGGGWTTGRWFGLAGGALASSLVFFLATNLAHWWLTNDYPHTPGGLLDCYVAALPFYRWMPVGDLVWTAVVFTALSAGLAAMRSSRVAASA
ncbi:MAG: hypothetical protein EBS56_00665 [Planctomycetia bacterium]|nr:hypothetical protein [Planctomycetia bacterium]